MLSIATSLSQLTRSDAEVTEVNGGDKTAAPPSKKNKDSGQRERERLASSMNSRMNRRGYCVGEDAKRRECNMKDRGVKAVGKK